MISNTDKLNNSPMYRLSMNKKTSKVRCTTVMDIEYWDAIRRTAHKQKMSVGDLIVKVFDEHGIVKEELERSKEWTRELHGEEI